MSQSAATSWSPVALLEDIQAGTVVPASLPSGPIAVWRTQSGRLSANGDRCPHRGMRLSHGFVRGETLSCIYHGWRYASDGKCTHIPAHPDMTPPESIRCDPIYAVEKDGIVWASNQALDISPPSIPAHKPLRSLRFAVPLVAFGHMDKSEVIANVVEVSLAGIPARLLLAACDADSTLVIVLVQHATSPETCIAVSRAVEVLRMKIETANKEIPSREAL